MVEIDDVPLGSVRINGGTQSRAELSQSTIAEYAEAIRLAVDLPPVVMFFDGAHFWLADGFHRYHAHREAGAMEIKAEIRTGTQRDAVLYSVGANASHGLRRSNEDKRKAVQTLLADPEWATWSDRQIAQQCSVSHSFVAAVRSPVASARQQANREASAVKKVTGVESDSTHHAPADAAPPLSISPTDTDAAAPPPAASPNSPPPAASAPSVATARGPAPEPGPVKVATEADSGAGQAAGRMIEVDEDEYNQLKAALAETIADNTEMGRVFDADDKLQAALAEIERHKAAAASAKQSLDSKMGENAQLIRTVKQLRRDVERERLRADAAEQQLAQMARAA